MANGPGKAPERAFTNPYDSVQAVQRAADQHDPPLNASTMVSRILADCTAQKQSDCSDDVSRTS